ncbi:MAG: ribosome recycling factor [Tepidiformaceae bacterium]
MTDPDEILLSAEERMDGAVQALKRELNGVRSGRAHPSLIETLPVDYYGAITPLKQLGTINAPEPRLLTVQVWDRGALKAIEKAFQTSELGLNPAIDGQLIRLPFPPLTEQRRKDLVKLVHSKTEESRIAVRNVRRHAHDELRKSEKEGLASQDDLKRNEEELQKLTDQHIALVDAEGKRKEGELLEG